MSYSTTAEPISLTFSLKKCIINCYYSISVLLQDLSSGFQENFQTEESVCTENNSEIIFKKKMFCNFYFEKNQRIFIKIIKKKLIDLNYKVKVYERLTVISSLINSPNSKYERKIDGNNIESEILSIQLDKNIINSDIKTNTLFDYFKSGVKFSCFLSADFSNSEKNPSLLKAKNNYKIIFKKISDIIANYTKKNLFYSYGFNAKIKNSLSDESIFNLNLNGKDSSIYTIEEVIKNFEKCTNTNSIMSLENINLSPIIKKITKDIYELYNLRYYNVSFIIIRGNINKNDIKNTIDAIIESSYLPLTTIVIGVENIDFTETRKILYSNNKYSSKGMQKLRDNVIFASLIHEFSNGVEQLITWCLIELSKQIISYYNLNKSSPENIYKNNLKNLQESFNIYNTISIERSKIIPDSDMKNLNQGISSLFLDNNNNNNQNNSNSFYTNKGNLEDKQNQSINNNINNTNPYSINNNNQTKSKTNNVKENNKKSNKGSNNNNVYGTPNFINEKISKYDVNDIKYNINNSYTNNGNENNQNVFVQTPNPSINVDNENSQNVFVQTPNPSINTGMTSNPYVKEVNQENLDTPGGPNTDYYENRKYKIPQQSIVGKSQMDKNYNPYDEELKNKDSRNFGESNNSLGTKKNNNISNGSEFNSTKNSENIKTSEYSQFNNNYSVENSQFK